MTFREGGTRGWLMAPREVEDLSDWELHASAADPWCSQAHRARVLGEIERRSGPDRAGRELLAKLTGPEGRVIA